MSSKNDLQVVDHVALDSEIRQAAELLCAEAIANGGVVTPQMWSDAGRFEFSLGVKAYVDDEVPQPLPHQLAGWLYAASLFNDSGSPDSACPDHGDVGYDSRGYCLGCLSHDDD